MATKLPEELTIIYDLIINQSDQGLVFGPPEFNTNSEELNNILSPIFDSIKSNATLTEILATRIDNEAGLEKITELNAALLQQQSQEIEKAKLETTNVEAKKAASTNFKKNLPTISDTGSYPTVPGINETLLKVDDAQLTEKIQILILFILFLLLLLIFIF